MIGSVELNGRRVHVVAVVVGLLEGRRECLLLCLVGVLTLTVVGLRFEAEERISTIVRIFHQIIHGEWFRDRVEEGIVMMDAHLRNRGLVCLVDLKSGLF